MAPRSEAFKRIRQRLRRSLRYGLSSRMDCLTIQLSELVCRYFENTGFHSNEKLDLDFATRVSYNSCLDPCSLVAAMILVERLRVKNPKAFAQFPPNDLYLSSIILATKFLNDCGVSEFIWNDEFSVISNLNIQRVNQLELRLLDGLQWDIMISVEEFDDAITQMERGVALHSAHSTGFLSYADINALVTEFRPYLDQLKRFFITSVTFSSAYLLLCFVSWGLLERSVQQKGEEMAVNETSIQKIAQTEIVNMFTDENRTSEDCQHVWEPLNETKIVELDQLEKILFGKNKMVERSVDEPKLINHPVKNCHLNFVRPANFLNSKLNPIVV